MITKLKLAVNMNTAVYCTYIYIYIAFFWLSNISYTITFVIISLHLKIHHHLEV